MITFYLFVLLRARIEFQHQIVLHHCSPHRTCLKEVVYYVYEKLLAFDIDDDEYASRAMPCLSELSSLFFRALVMLLMVRGAVPT